MKAASEAFPLKLPCTASLLSIVNTFSLKMALQDELVIDMGSISAIKALLDDALEV